MDENKKNRGKESVINILSALKEKGRVVKNDKNIPNLFSIMKKIAERRNKNNM